MKNKFLKLVFSVVLVLSATLLIASCGDDEKPHEHSYDTDVWKSDATGHWNPAVCGHNDQKGNFVAHLGVADDCKCDVCRYVTHTFTETLLHDDDGHWYAPSCGNIAHRNLTPHVGMEDCKCDECGRTVHTYETVKENEISATCTEGGSYESVVYCTVCEIEVSRTPVSEDPLGHTLSEAVKENETPATCTEGGSYESVVHCTVCEVEVSRTPVSEDPLGHTPAEAVKENEIAPTCTEAGSYKSVVYCSVCGDLISSKNMQGDAALGHSFGSEWLSSADGHYHACVNPGCKEIDELIEHIDENSDEICDVCSGNIHTHTPGEITVENVKPATCTEPATEDHVIYCTDPDCKARISRQTVETAPAAGHTNEEAVKENETPATCTEDGSYDSVIYCSVCNKEVSRNTVTTLATGHKAGEPVKVNEILPTCTEDGSYESVVYCSVCGVELSRTTETVASIGSHVPAEAVKENENPATCTEGGSYDSVIYCAACGEEISREVVTTEPTGHVYSEEWSTSESEHWHAPACGHDVENKDVGAHVGMDDCLCDECGYASHTFGNAWYHDENGHWHIASCGNADHIADYSAHVGMDDCVCDECGYVSHSFSDEWNSTDENYHWHDATCSHKAEKSDYEKHDMVSGICKDCGYIDPDQSAVELPIIPA